MMLDKLKNLGPKEKFLVATILFVVAVPVVGALVVFPAFKRCQVLDSKILSTNILIAENRSELAVKNSTQAKYDGIRDSLAKATIVEEDIEALKAAIEDLADHVGLEYSTLSHREPEKVSEFCDEYIVEIGKFKSEMQNLLMFAHELHATPGMLRIASVNIKPVKDDTKVTGSIKISKVMIADAAGREPADADLPEGDE